MTRQIRNAGKWLGRRIDFGILVSTVVTGGLLAALLLMAVRAHAAEGGAADVGFIVAAPDRGFQGNEEVRDAFEAFAARYRAALVVVTDERTRTTLNDRLAALVAQGVRRIVVLPLFLSRHDPRFVRLEALVTTRAPAAKEATLTLARPFGESYFAVESLADRLHAVAEPRGRRVIVVGDGADDPEALERMQADWAQLARRAGEALPFESVEAIVWNSAAQDYDGRRRELKTALARAAAGAARVTLVPFHLQRKLDGMMTFTNDLKRLAPPGAEVLPEAPLTDVSTWLAHEANRHLPLAAEDIGVVILAHGSDYHWNETLRATLRPLERRYRVEYCFSMADPPLIERSIRRLEARGARAAVVVRVFGLGSSFAADVERLFGLDLEAPQHAAHAHGYHAHGHHGTARRIRTPLVVRTVGGLDDHPLFAQALLERALTLSKDPARETVILTAHGAGDDARNRRWLEILESLARQMRAGPGKAFRAIHFLTWREDWPDKRGPWIEKGRRLVTEAARDGGRALVVAARTNGEGPEREFLEGLDFAIAGGFAPHPLFVQWVEEQIGRAGLAGPSLHNGSFARGSSASQR